MKVNYQYKYAKKLRDNNIMEYYDQHQVVKHNNPNPYGNASEIFVLRDEQEETLSDCGEIIPARLWKIGRSSDAKIFQKINKKEAMDLYVMCSSMQVDPRENVREKLHCRHIS